MAKLYEVEENSKDKLKREKSSNYRRKGERRFYSNLEMSIVKQDIANYNGAKKRGEMRDEPNGYIVECGCGGRGCFVHNSYKGKTNEKGIELLKNIMNKSKKANNKEKDEQNELIIKKNGFDTKISFRG